MNYIGSKHSLLGEIESLLHRNNIDHSGVFCDLFSGTSVVAQMARKKGFSVVSNDLQHYSYALQSAFVGCTGYPQFQSLRTHIRPIDEIKVQPNAKDSGILEPGGAPMATFGVAGNRQELVTYGLPLARVLLYLNGLPPQNGLFVERYCEGGKDGRNYFNRQNGMSCQAIRDSIHTWRQNGWIDRNEFHVLLASLLESIDQVANTASVYGAYLKQIKASAQKPLRLKIPLLLNGSGNHRVCQEDANALVRRLAGERQYEILYIDPPYNRRQYHSNYHLLETIARWDLDEFIPSGKTGLRPESGQRSVYSIQSGAIKAMTDLIAQANFKHIIVSYNNEGIVPESHLIELLSAKFPNGARDFRKFPYKRFRADNDGESRAYKGDEVQEFLFYAGV